MPPPSIHYARLGATWAVRVLPLVYLGCSLPSFAACAGEISGRSATYGVALEPVDGCASDETFITFWPLTKKGESQRSVEQKQVLFDEECRSLKTGFACKTKGRTPLAGATYRLTKDRIDECDGSGRTKAYRYTCVRGCNGLVVPKYLEMYSYEC
jgi:hypothetical protein